MNRAPTATAPPNGWVAPKVQNPNNMRAFIVMQMFNYVFQDKSIAFLQAGHFLLPANNFHQNNYRRIG
jgi:hypothetical protein